MSELRPDRATSPFRPGEIDGVPGLAPDDLAADARTARELESLAVGAGTPPAADFVDRVMAAVAVEPGPAPARTARLALRRRSLGAFVASIADAWRVTTRPGFPISVRAQAFALVLLVVGLFAGSGLATAGAIGLLEGNRDQGPQPTQLAPSLPADLATPTPTTPSETDPTDATPSTEPASPEQATTEPTGTPEPAKTDKGGDNHGDGRGGSATQAPHRTPKPTDGPDDHGGDGGGGDGGDGGDDHEDSTRHATPVGDAEADGDVRRRLGRLVGRRLRDRSRRIRARARLEATTLAA